MSVDEVRLHVSTNHRQSLQDQLVLLNQSKLYNDTQIICQDGAFWINSLLAGLVFPELYSAPAFFSQQLTDKTVIFPDISRAEAIQQVEILLRSTEDLVKAEHFDVLDELDSENDELESNSYRFKDDSPGHREDQLVKFNFIDLNKSTLKCRICSVNFETKPENKIKVRNDGSILENEICTPPPP